MVLAKINIQGKRNEDTQKKYIDYISQPNHKKKNKKN
jgi:acyl-CoA-binding protein